MRKKIHISKSAYLIGAAPYLFKFKMTSPDDTKRRIVTPSYSRYPKGGGGVQTLREFVIEFVNWLNDATYFDENKTGIQLIRGSLDLTVDNEIRCVISAGKYGIESELHNVKSNSVKHRDKSDCELMPFVCRFVFNELYSDVILVAEKYGQYSVVGILFSALEKFAKEKFVEWSPTLEFGPITNLKYVEMQYRQNVKALHFLTHTIPADLADKVIDDNSDVNNYKVDIRISAVRGRKMPVGGFLARLRSAKQRGALIGGTKYDDVKVELKVGSKTQTVIAGTDSFRVTFDVTGKVDLRSNGHPTIESFVAATNECVEMSKETINWLNWEGV